MQEWCFLAWQWRALCLSSIPLGHSHSVFSLKQNKVAEIMKRNVLLEQVGKHMKFWQNFKNVLFHIDLVHQFSHKESPKATLLFRNNRNSQIRKNGQIMKFSHLPFIPSFCFGPSSPLSSSLDVAYMSMLHVLMNIR